MGRGASIYEVHTKLEILYTLPPTLLLFKCTLALGVFAKPLPLLCRLHIWSPHKKREAVADDSDDAGSPSDFSVRE